MDKKSIHEYHLAVRKTARYYAMGDLNKQTKQIWVVLHGFGYLASDFIQWFSAIADEHTLIIAPEALSRSYLSGTWGKVGASWMTKEDRLNEIDDYVNYLNELLIKITGVSGKKTEINCLGFSQGVATACRWVASDVVPVKKLVLWSGTPPFDTDYKKSKNLRNAEIRMCYGNDDKYISEKKVNEIKAFFDKNDFLHIKMNRFEGGHEIREEDLIQAMKDLS
jgi:predicted esterase